MNDDLLLELRNVLNDVVVFAKSTVERLAVLDSIDTRLATLEKRMQILLDNLPLLQEVHADSRTQAAVELEKERVRLGAEKFMLKMKALEKLGLVPKSKTEERRAGEPAGQQERKAAKRLDSNPGKEMFTREDRILRKVAGLIGRALGTVEIATTVTMAQRAEPHLKEALRLLEEENPAGWDPGEQPSGKPPKKKGGK